MDWLYTVSGFVVGAIVGLTGVGGGSLMTPLLVLLFGIPAGCILGTLKVLADRIREIRKGEEDAYRNY